MKVRPDQVDKIVKPRKVDVAERVLPIIAVSLSDQVAFLERTSEVVPITDLPGLVRSEPSSIWACANVAWLVAQLDKALDASPLWQFRAAPYRRDVVSVRNVGFVRKPQVTGTIVSYFGYKGQAKHKGHWHYPLDPVVFTADLSVRSSHVRDLFTWAEDVRAWCQQNRLTITPTAGGLAGQLLRDPRFYPEARRKVPRKTNARARAALPGNHYALYARESEVTDAVYLDMTAAHHNAALDTTFPHADGLYARGHFRALDPTDTTVPTDTWADRHSKKYRQLMEASHGLLLCAMSVPDEATSAARFPLPIASRTGRYLGWVYTNEVQYLLDSGVSIDSIHAAWVSFRPDPGLNRYASFALAAIAAAEGSRKEWLKPALLSAYGILAARPRTQEFGYKRADRGVTKHYPAGNGVLTVKAHISMTEQEVATVNVIHRGLIEAETRLRSLRMARYLTERGCRVLSIYADAVMVEAGAPLPLLPHPWAIKQELTRLRFLHPTQFHSTEMVKLPGVRREGIERVRRIEVARRAGVESRR